MANLALEFSGIDVIGSNVSSPIDSDGSSLYVQSDLSPFSDGNSSDDSDFSDAALKFISQMLLEEDLEDQPCMLQDCVTLQVAEKSFYDVLAHDSPHPSDHSVESDWVSDLTDTDRDEKYNNSSISRVRKKYEDGEFGEERSSKCLAPYIEENNEQFELFDEVLLCKGGSESDLCCEKTTQTKKTRGKKERNKNQVVDLRLILTLCAQAVMNNDLRAANEQLNQIRLNSSPFGDASQRLAHYFANALEARMAGTGTLLYTALAAKKTSAAEVLSAYKLYMAACPFKKVAALAAALTIADLMEKSTTLHIIDFGILYGYQWPSLIQRFSNMTGGPPKIRITGIDLPQPGFRPAERIEETGRRLAKYCERFGVEFEYTAIAKKWETIRLEDLKIDRDEVTIVNCFYRLKTVPDEMAGEKSARDRVLKLIRRIDPNMFFHCAMNGSYSAPLFVSRFREALYHYMAMFDILETNVAREDGERMLFEREILGRDVMNVIACEGLERVDRPETFKQWDARSVRAGLRLVPLKKGIVEQAKTKVKLHYHKDFLVCEDGGWLLQGWKGRILYALSCWKRA